MPLMRPRKLTMAATLAAAGLCSAAAAEQALIVANFAYEGAAAKDAVRSRAEDVSEMLLGLGYDVRRLENPGREQVDTALAALAAQEGPVVLYYAGRSEGDASRTRLLMTNGSSMTFAEVLEMSGANGREATMAFLDICLEPIEAPAPAEELPVADDETRVAVEEPDPIFAGIGPVPAIDGLFVASPMPAGVACAAHERSLAETMLERLSVPGLDLATLFSGSDVATTSTISSPLILRAVDTGQRLTAEDYRMLERLSPEAQEQMLALWAEAGIAVDRDDGPAPARTPQMVTTETVVLTSPVKPVSSGGVTLTPVTPTVSRVQDGVSLTPQTPQPVQTAASTPRPVPGAGGLPRPLIIVGLIAPTEASFATATEPTGPVSGSAIEYADIDGRRALRDSDPDLFATLVDGGAFDPPQAELVVALQTELSRMNCYNAGIDGAWGPGSRGAVGRYYEQIGSASPSQDPDVAIFRQIMIRDDVTCPAVARAAPAQRTSAPQRTAPATPRRTTPTPTPTAPTPTAPSRTINRSTGTGIFR